MRKLFFYPHIAATNIKKHGRLYAPYIISAIITVAMFYVMGAITSNEGVQMLSGASYLSMVLKMGWVIIGIFSLIFLLYTNSFLMKQRKKELGLYNVLGMEKRHISRIMFFETFFVSLISIIPGMVFGIVFDKLATLVLCRILHFEIKLGFSISPLSIAVTSAVFAAIFLISLVSNIVRIKKAKTIELLHSAAVGEKEPRTKWLLTIIGVIALAAGYTIAIVVKSPLEALVVFFFAVICVIIGTYCLFTSGSIAVLKLMRKNKKYYYKPRHFTSVSGMLYRMKQNAVGLANICILSTMVLVMISTTVSMYAGTEDSLNRRYSTDVNVEVRYTEKTEYYNAKMMDIVENTVEGCGRKMNGFEAFSFLSFATSRKGNDFIADGYNYSSTSSAHEFCIVTAEQYKQLTGNTVILNKDEVAVFDSANKIDGSFNLFGKTYKVKKKLDAFPSISDFSTLLVNIHYTVVADDSVIYELDREQRAAFGENASSMVFNMQFDLDGTDKEKVQCARTIRDNLGDHPKGVSFFVDSKQVQEDDFYAMYGSFLFLGIILGLLFLMVTVMIIYYKQVSEGYDDKRRFEIMQQVGMSKSEVKKTISNQILTVFFLPLVTAFIHLAFAFPIISRLMIVFNFTNTAVFVIGLLVTAAAFAAIYAAVYSLTAKAYYRIVSD